MTSRKKVTAVAVLVLAACSLVAVAEIPRKTPSELSDEASHAFRGTVVQTYHRKAKPSESFEFFYSVAEISVEKVQQGDEIEVGDRVFVRYWRKRWVGEGGPAPDHYGHWNIPEAEDAVEVYVKGDRKTGYDVLSPNGFFETTRPAATTESPAGD